MAVGISIREAAERSGLSVHTLRYYEQVGLVTPPERATNGHRRYNDGDLEWLYLLTRLRATGMPIAVMAHRAAVAKRLAELAADLDLIDHKIGIYLRMETEHA